MPHDSAGSAANADPRAVAAFLRGLAERVEGDAAFGRAVAALLVESGLLAETAGRPGTARGSKARRAESGTGTATTAAGTARAARDASGASEGAAAPDPFALLRERGEEGLRAALGRLEVGVLRQVVRQHRLDPARISARWTNRERVVDLIVSQVRARSDHGKAFARV